VGKSIIIIIYISPSIDPLQGQRPTGYGSSQSTLSSHKILLDSRSKNNIGLHYDLSIGFKLYYTNIVFWVRE